MGGLLEIDLIRQLTNEYEVFSIVRNMPIKPIKSVNYVKIDLSKNWNSMQLPSDVDAIIHLAQSLNFRNFPNKAEDIFNVNIVHVEST